MHLSTWNLNHRTFRKAIPPSLPAALLALSADVLVLTEFVEAKPHQLLRATLTQAGFVAIHTTPRTPGQNQVLIAARFPFEVLPGPLAPPDAMAGPNLLHVRLTVAGMDLVGLRVPFYRRAQQWRDYWAWLEPYLAGLTARPTVVLGDFNLDPFRHRRRGMPSLRRLQALGWTIGQPIGPWSYWSNRGPHSKVDQVIASPGLKIENARYIARQKGFIYAGPDPEALSDHAVLSVEVA